MAHRGDDQPKPMPRRDDERLAYLLGERIDLCYPRVITQHQERRGEIASRRLKARPMRLAELRADPEIDALACAAEAEVRSWTSRRGTLQEGASQVQACACQTGGPWYSSSGNLALLRGGPRATDSRMSRESSGSPRRKSRPAPIAAVRIPRKSHQQASPRSVALAKSVPPPTPEWKHHVLGPRLRPWSPGGATSGFRTGIGEASDRRRPRPACIGTWSPSTSSSSCCPVTSCSPARGACRSTKTRSAGTREKDLQRR